jgi:hypothetical protein
VCVCVCKESSRWQAGKASNCFVQYTATAPLYAAFMQPPRPLAKP